MSEPWTPGPWRWSAMGYLVSADDVVIGDPAVRVAYHADPDALLIAAAPEMAELLNDVAGKHGDDCPAYLQEGPCACLPGLADALLERIRGTASES